MQTTFLLVNGIKKSFDQGKNEINVLHDVTATFKQGVSYAITGVSGTGKSTLMHILVGLDTPTAGTVLFHNTIGSQDIHQMTPREHACFLRGSVGLLFQLPYLIKELSVLENIMLPGLISGSHRHECQEKAMMLLKEVGIDQKADQKPGSLSGGQQQRVALARALINRPAFLIADEPTGNLDEHTAKEMVELLLRLQNEWHMGIIVSTHDMYVSEHMQCRYRLHDGKLDAL